MSPRLIWRQAVGLLMACLFTGFSSWAFASQLPLQWMVHLPQAASAADSTPAIRQFLNDASQRLGVPVVEVRPMFQPNTWLVRLKSTPLSQTLQTLNGISTTLNGIPGVAFASPDITLYARAQYTPNDPLFSTEQSAYMATGDYASMNMPQVWGQTRGDASRVIAVLDTGVIYNHPELRGRLLPGYDFVSNPTPPTGTRETGAIQSSGSNDGDGRDPDPSDPGDAPPPGSVCPDGSTTSSFHGTAVASVAAAMSNNGQFLSGMDMNAKILPVRVAGRCGSATSSDILDAMYWAIGSATSDPSIPANPNPANVINLSFATSSALGSNCTDASSAAFRLAISAARAKNVAVVIAAGNNSGGAVEFPASCPGVIAAGAVQSDGKLASYSARGSSTNDLTIMAPGNAQGYYVTAFNKGISGGSSNGAPDPNGNTATLYAGTSFSTPMVAGLLSLLESADPQATVADLTNILKTTALPYPAGACSGSSLLGSCNCTSSSCGAGIISPVSALQAARSQSGLPLADVPASQLVSGDSTNLDASLSNNSGGGATGLTYAWSQVYGSPTTMADTSSPILAVTSGLASNIAEYRLKVTDVANNQVGSADVRVVSNTVNEQTFQPSSTPTGSANTGGGTTTTSPSQSGSGGGSASTPAPSQGGGGGGAIPPIGIFALAALLWAYRRVCQIHA